MLLLLPGSVLGATDYPACNIEKTRAIAFSSSGPTDTFKIQIVGIPCYEATLSISVTNSKGVKVYKYEAPFKPHIPVDWEDPDLDRIADSFATYTLEKSYWGQSTDLPVWEYPTVFYDKNSTSVVVTQEQYEKYRKHITPVLWHHIHYEGWRHIVYDRKAESAVVVLEGGL